MRYRILRGAVWCGTVHTCSHNCFIDRFMMSEGGDPLSLLFTSKTGQSHSVVHVFFFFFLLASKETKYFGIL